MNNKQIPEGWKLSTLRDICDQVNYGFTASAIKEPIGPKFLRITDIVPNLIDWESVPYCDVNDVDINKYLLNKGDIVIARTGATTGYAKRIQRHPESIFASYLVRLRINSDYDNLYVGKIIESDVYKAYIRTNIGGSAQPGANAQVLTSFPILLPPLPTQRKIAAILSGYDELIENNTRRIKILEEMAQAIYREWFVHYRFPGHEAVKLVDSGTELGMVPEGWKVKNLFQIAQVTYGYGFKSELFTNEFTTTPVVRIRDIPVNSTETYTTEGVSDTYLISDGDILVGMDGEFHMCKWAWGNAYLNQRVARFRPIENFPRYLLFFLLKTPVEYFNATITGTTVAHLGDRHLKTINILVPQKSIQLLAMQILEPIFDLEISLRKKNTLLRKTRDLLLPKLISGELDVSEMEIAISK